MQSSVAVSEQLRRAVDWKIFEISAHLINPDAHHEHLMESIKWFQPRHAEEVIEERHCGGLCGYPLCGKPIKAASNGRAATYRIDYYEKKIYEIEKSIHYCSVSCIEKAELWIKQLDITLPYGRPIAKALKKANYKPTGIDDIIGVLTETEPSNVTEKTRVEELTAVRDPSLPSPPLYQPPRQLSNRGEVMGVKFVHGEPVVPAAAADPVATDTLPPTAENSIKVTQAPSAIPSNTSIDEIMKTMKELQLKHGLVRPPSTVATTPAAGGTITVGASSSDKVKNLTIPSTTNSANATLSLKSALKKPLSSLPPQPQVNEAEHKHNHQNETKVEVKAAEDEKAQVKQEEETEAARVQQQDQADMALMTSETRYQPTKPSTDNNNNKKSVEWSLPVASKPRNNNNNNSSNNNVIRAANQKALSIMKLNVLEHPTAQPLSVAAILTKREPEPEQPDEDDADEEREREREREGLMFGNQSLFPSSLSSNSNSGSSASANAGSIEGYVPKLLK